MRIEVHDAGGLTPEFREALADEEGGRGLGLVDVLTGGAWGVSDRDGPGKAVLAVCTGRGEVFLRSAPTAVTDLRRTRRPPPPGRL